MLLCKKLQNVKPTNYPCGSKLRKTTTQNIKNNKTHTYQDHPVWVSWLDFPTDVLVRTPRQDGPGKSTLQSSFPPNDYTDPVHLRRRTHRRRPSLLNKAMASENLAFSQNSTWRTVLGKTQHRLHVEDFKTQKKS